MVTLCAQVNVLCLDRLPSVEPALLPLIALDQDIAAVVLP